MIHMYVCAVYTNMCEINIHTYEEVCISSLPLLHILLSFTLLALFVDSQMATTNNKNRSWTCPHSLLAHAHTHTHSCLCVRCCPLNQLCGSSALVGSFFLSLSLFLFALLLLLLQSKKLLMYPVSSPFSVSFPL